MFTPEFRRTCLFTGGGKSPHNMAEDNRLADAPVLEIDLRSVFSGDCVHEFISRLVRLDLVWRFCLCRQRGDGQADRDSHTHAADEGLAA